MTLQENGKHKKPKYVKCDRCKNRIDINSDDVEIIKLAGVTYVECLACGQQIILKK